MKQMIIHSQKVEPISHVTEFKPTTWWIPKNNDGNYIIMFIIKSS